MTEPTTTESPWVIEDQRKKALNLLKLEQIYKLTLLPEQAIACGKVPPNIACIGVTALYIMSLLDIDPIVGHGKEGCGPQDFLPDRIVPAADGGIYLYWFYPQGKRVWYMCDNEGVSIICTNMAIKPTRFLAGMIPGDLRDIPLPPWLEALETQSEI